MIKYGSHCALPDTAALINNKAVKIYARKRGTLLSLSGKPSRRDCSFSTTSQRCSMLNVKIRKMTEARYIRVGDYNVFPWATSGLESSVIVNGPGRKDRIAFDMGYAHKESHNCSDVFISHGHMDHISGIASHASIRALKGHKQRATYYLPTHLREPLIRVLEGFSAMTEDNVLDLVHLKTIEPGTDIVLSSERTIRAFPTIHRVKSQGYLVLRTQRTLKEEYRHLPGPEIGKLAKEGVQIKDETIVPDVAYTGDSTFEIFLNPPDPNLLKVKLLITESTYIDDEIDKEGRGGQQRARERGHMHLQEFIDNAAIFSEVDKIILLHFSDKYSIGYLKQKTADMLKGSPLEEKIIIGAIHKETFG